ncbi:MAG: type II toxin-antitoxin system HicA family toxin [Candidatus Poribacteria bacterium]
MTKLPRLTSQEAERLLLSAGFELVRSKGSHRIYMKEQERIVIPYHRSKILHPKVIKQVLESIEYNIQ